MAGILIVDDVEFFRRELRELLTGWGWEVCGEAADGLAAVGKYRELKPALVILDLFMPGMDGFAALKAIRDMDGEARVIVCSAASQKDLIIRAVRMGACDYISKPVAEERMYRAIAGILGPPPSGNGG